MVYNNNNNININTQEIEYITWSKTSNDSGFCPLQLLSTYM